MVMRYAHPTAAHQIDSVKRLELFNAAKQIAEAEKREKAIKNQTLDTISDTVPDLLRQDSVEAVTVN
jgi:hypothetical protein